MKSNTHMIIYSAEKYVDIEPINFYYKLFLDELYNNVSHMKCKRTDHTNKVHKINFTVDSPFYVKPELVEIILQMNLPAKLINMLKITTDKNIISYILIDNIFRISDYKFDYSTGKTYDEQLRIIVETFRRNPSTDDEYYIINHPNVKNHIHELNNYIFLI